MTLELALIIGFIFHLVGDYLTQNDWMAREKTRSHVVCFIHCLFYSLPFVLLMLQHPYMWGIIFWSHFFIDRFRLAQYWIRLVNWKWDGAKFGFADDKPAFMYVWLMIIVDNTLHILINSAVIYFSY
jgi:hypothetical protein